MARRPPLEGTRDPDGPGILLARHHRNNARWSGGEGCRVSAPIVWKSEVWSRLTPWRPFLGHLRWWGVPRTKVGGVGGLNARPPAGAGAHLTSSPVHIPYFLLPPHWLTTIPTSLHLHLSAPIPSFHELSLVLSRKKGPTQPIFPSCVSIMNHRSISKPYCCAPCDPVEVQVGGRAEDEPSMGRPFL